jgi:hypothetical protein
MSRVACEQQMILLGNLEDSAALTRTVQEVVKREPAGSSPV